MVRSRFELDKVTFFTGSVQNDTDSGKITIMLKICKILIIYFFITIITLYNFV